MMVIRDDFMYNDVYLVVSRARKVPRSPMMQTFMRGTLWMRTALITLVNKFVA